MRLDTQTSNYESKCVGIGSDWAHDMAAKTGCDSTQHCHTGPHTVLIGPTTCNTAAQTNGRDSSQPVSPGHALRNQCRYEHILILRRQATQHPHSVAM